MLVQQLLELEQNARALDRRGFAPGGKGGLGGLTEPVTLPVAGLNTSLKRPLVGAAGTPPM